MANDTHTYYCMLTEAGVPADQADARALLMITMIGILATLMVVL